MAVIHDIIDNEDFNSIIFAGDLNADPQKGRFWQEFISLTKDLGLLISDLCLPSNTFTYLSPAHNTTSWLDHAIVSNVNEIHNINIDLNVPCFDHFSLSFQLQCNLFIFQQPLSKNLMTSFVN